MTVAQLEQAARGFDDTTAPRLTYTPIVVSVRGRRVMEAGTAA